MSQQLISHFPCDLSCRASADVGEIALSALREEDALAADALVTLLRSPITVWDRVRFLVEHADAGLCHGGHMTDEARLFTHPGFQSFVAALPDRPDGGVRLVFDGDVT